MTAAAYRIQLFLLCLPVFRHGYCRSSVSYLKAIQDRYKGKNDQPSREAMSREAMALHAAAGTNPFISGCTLDDLRT